MELLDLYSDNQALKDFQLSSSDDSTQSDMSPTLEEVTNKTIQKNYKIELEIQAKAQPNLFQISNYSDYIFNRLQFIQECQDCNFYKIQQWLDQKYLKNIQNRKMYEQILCYIYNIYYNQQSDNQIELQKQFMFCLQLYYNLFIYSQDYTNIETILVMLWNRMHDTKLISQNINFEQLFAFPENKFNNLISNKLFSLFLMINNQSINEKIVQLLDKHFQFHQQTHQQIIKQYKSSTNSQKDNNTRIMLLYSTYQLIRYKLSKQQYIREELRVLIEHVSAENDVFLNMNIYQIL